MSIGLTKSQQLTVYFHFSSSRTAISTLPSKLCPVQDSLCIMLGLSRNTPTPHQVSRDASASVLFPVLRSVCNKLWFWENFDMQPSYATASASLEHTWPTKYLTQLPFFFISYELKLFIILAWAKSSPNISAFRAWIYCSLHTYLTCSWSDHNNLQW